MARINNAKGYSNGVVVGVEKINDFYEVVIMNVNSFQRHYLQTTNEIVKHLIIGTFVKYKSRNFQITSLQSGVIR